MDTAKMPTISILTACLPSRADYLTETAASVAAASEALAEAGFGLEWVVAFDGPLQGGQHMLIEADRTIATHKHVGVSAARNSALSFATGAYVACLDADDLLVPDGLLAAIAAFKSEPWLGWAALNRTTLDGLPTVHWHEHRAWDRIGELAENWRTPFPFQPNTMVVRRELVFRAGGWPALELGEDLLFAMVCAECSPGISLREVMVRYRQWDGQAMNEGHLVERRRIAFPFIEGRLNALRTVAGRSSVEAPEINDSFLGATAAAPAPVDESLTA